MQRSRIDVLIHVLAPVPAAPLLLQLPADVPEKTAEDDPGSWVVANTGAMVSAPAYPPDPTQAFTTPCAPCHYACTVIVTSEVL